MDQRKSTYPPWHLGHRGVSLVELSISMALMGVVGLAITSLLSKPTQFVSMTTEKLDQAALADAQGAALIRHLSRTYPMRRGFFSCGDNAINTLFSSRAALPSAGVLPANFEWNDNFSIVASRGASLAAVNDDDDVIIPGSSQISEGSVILLSLMNQPDLPADGIPVGGVYRVTAADYDNDAYTVEPLAQIPPQLGCAIANSLSLSTLLADPQSVMAGVSTRTYRADVITVLRYDVRNGAKGRTLVESTWPVGTTDAVRELVTFDDYQGLSFENVRWAPQNGAVGIHGVFTSGLIVRQNAPVGSRGLAATKRRSRQIAYSTSDGGNVNTGLVLTPPTAAYTFPSCALVASSVRGLFNFDDDQYSDMYRIEARAMGTTTAAKVDVRLSTTGADGPLCWNEQEATRSPLNQLEFSEALGKSSIISVGTSGSAIICDAPPGSVFTGQLLYFHAALNTAVRIPCSEASIPDTPITYVYDGPATRCRLTGEIEFGKLVLGGSSPPEPGPILFVGDDGCEWATPPASARPDNFSDCQPDPARGNLLRIRIRPTDIPVNIPNAVNCVP